MKKDAAKRYAAELYALIKDQKDARAAEIIRSFAKLLAGTRRLRLAPKILKALEEEAMAGEGRARASVKTAEPMSGIDADSLRKALEKATGRKIELRQESDPSLIAGLVIRYGDTLLDASLKRRLERLKETLTV